MAANGGSPCPSSAPARSYNVSVFNRTLPMDGNPDANGVIYALTSDEAGIQNGTLPTVPLVLRANSGDCVSITLKNDLPSTSAGRAGLTLGKLPYDPQGSSGVAIGFNPDSSIAPGQSFTYQFWADRELGTNIFLNEANESTLAHGAFAALVAHGAFGALVVEPSGSTYTSVKDNSTLSSGVMANIRSSSGKFREFVALFQDNDPQIGRSIMEYDPSVATGVSAVNYGAAPLANRYANGGNLSTVFSSPSQGDPSTTLFRAYPGDPVRFRVAVPFSANIHSFSLDGHSWPWEPNMPGSQILNGRTITSGETIDAQLIGGAGGTLGVAGDYLYLDHRYPFTQAGLWGIFRVYGQTQSDLVPL
jgi:hypothetical protein